MNLINLVKIAGDDAKPNGNPKNSMFSGCKVIPILEPVGSNGKLLNALFKSNVKK